MYRKELCEGPPGEGECSFCCGSTDLMMMEVILQENSRMAKDFNGFKDLECLKEAEKNVVSILRETLLGRRKFSDGNWKRMIDIITEIRAAEIIEGLKTVLVREIAKKDTPLVKNELQQLIRMIIQFSIGVETRKLLDDRVAVYNIRTGNRVEFVKGRLEVREVERSDTMIVALGGYFCVTKGVPRGSHFEDLELGSRCTRITGLHVLASEGKASLSGGIPNKKDEALLPMPLERNKPSIPDDDFKKLMPISVYKSDRL